MRRLFLSMLLVAALAALAAGPAAARGLTAEQLADSGWTCFPVPGLGVHCMQPSKQFGDRQIQLLYFDEQTGRFAGTETLVRSDVFQAGRQCPTEPGGWFFIPDIGYYGCHRN